MSDAEGKLKLTDDYYMGSDGKMNLILYEIYEKRESKGKYAPSTGEKGLQPIGYYGTLQGLVKGLLKKDVIKTEIGDFMNYASKLENIQSQILESLEKFESNKPKDFNLQGEIKNEA